MSAKTNGQKAPERQEASKQRPVFEARFGRLRASVWRQESDKGPWFNIVLSRLYKDNDDQWQSANTFGVRDLLEVGKLCDLAHSWIHREMAKSRNPNGQEDDSDQGDIPY